MANMPFKLSYSFEGNCRTRPEQNLSGASKKETRELLLHRAHEERQKREDQRLKMKSTLIIQSYIRSYLTRKYNKQVQRIEFDQQENILDLKGLLRKLLFFYNSRTDNDRLFRTCEKLLKQHPQIMQEMDRDNSLNWLIRRTLCVCLNELFHPKLSEITLYCINVFTSETNSRAKLTIWPYLMNKGYFYQFRKLLDICDSEKRNRILDLIRRPFESISNLSIKDSELVLLRFSVNFLCPKITPAVKTTLIPYLQQSQAFPYKDIIKFLNSNQNYDSTHSLFYCVLALEPANYVPTKDSLQVLSSLSINIYQTFAAEIDLSEGSDDEDEMEISTEQVSLQDYIHLLNCAERVKRIITFVEEHTGDEELLLAVIQLCHNLLLVFKDSLRKFMLVFMLALSGHFLNEQWQLIKKHEAALLQITGGCLGQWRDIHMAISVFCDMFTFYTETVTDSESTDTSGTFANSNLSSMADILKNLALSLVDVAFPMCRSSSILATPEILHLYNSCLSCVKTLYMLDLRKNFCKPGFWTKKKIHISQDLSRKNYLSKTIKPFYGLVSEYEDEHLPPLSTIEQRSLAILQHLPFLIEFNTRVLLLRDLCRFSLGENDATRLHREFLSDGSIVIRRTHLYEDSFEKLSHQNESDLRQKIRIQFINNAGLEEAGIDGGGIFKEFVNEVLKTSFDPNRGFFLLTNDNMLYPNPNVGLLIDDFMEHYYFIGRLVGKAIFENILVDLPLAEFFLVKLLIDRADAHYLKSLDPVLYRNLLYLRDYSGDVQDLGLDFTTISNDLGKTKVVELKPNGSRIPVTNYNRLEYIHRLANLKLNTQIKKQCLAFREGIDNVVPLLWLKLFNHLELQVIISGDTQEMDIEDLKAHTSYGGEFNVNHATVRLFWNIVHKFTDSQKKQLLKFVTSCSRPPLLGFKELNPPFSIQSSGTEDRMPTASTCLNLLKLPIIKNEEVLRKKLLSAIEQQAGFELS